MGEGIDQDALECRVISRTLKKRQLSRGSIHHMKSESYRPNALPSRHGAPVATRMPRMLFRNSK